MAPPQIEIGVEPDELDLSDLDHLDPNMVATIQERVKAKLDRNKVHAHKALTYSNGLTRKLYSALAETANVTSDSVCMFLKLFSVNETNHCRLVKSKMVNILKPAVRRALLRDNSGSTQGIFGGDLNTFRNLEESKKQTALLETVMLQTKKPGKAGKAGIKGGKKPAAKEDPRARVRKALRKAQKRRQEEL